MFEKLYQNFLEKDKEFVRYCENLKTESLDLSFFFTTLDSMKILFENIKNLGSSSKEKLLFLESRLFYYQEMLLVQKKLKQKISLSGAQDFTAYSRLLQLITMYDKLKSNFDMAGDVVRQVNTFHKVQNQLNSIYQGLFQTDELLEEQDVLPRIKSHQESEEEYLSYIRNFYSKEKEEIKSEEGLEYPKELQEFSNDLASLFESPDEVVKDPVELIHTEEDIVISEPPKNLESRKDLEPTKEDLESYRTFLTGFYHEEKEQSQDILEEVSSVESTLPVKDETLVIEETSESLLADIYKKVSRYQEKTGIALLNPNLTGNVSFHLLKEGLLFPEPEKIEEPISFEPVVLIGDYFQISLNSNAYSNATLGSDGSMITKPLYAPNFARTVLESYFLNEEDGSIRIAYTNEQIDEYGFNGFINIGVKGEDGCYKLSDVEKVNQERVL